MTSLFQEDEFVDEDELDLLELISSDTNNTNQYLIFIGSNDEVYAINVAKVQELLVYKDLHKTPQSSEKSLIKSTADIRDKMTSIVNFDEWFGNKILSDDEYELIILASYGGQNMGIMIKSVEYIMTINLESMQNSSNNDPKISFVAKIRLNSEDRLCTIFDGDKFLADVFEDVEASGNSSYIKECEILIKDKMVLFADDSRYIRKVISEMLNKLKLEYHIFENGKELFNFLQTKKHQDIGLIVTDLEMPIMDGSTLIKEIRADNRYNDIDIIVHTNMNNSGLNESLLAIGASEIIGKLEVSKLANSIERHFS